MIELLAPAGEEKSFFNAINNGANAIYLGLKDFSARKNAENFTSDNISFYLSYAHALGVKVYVAVNTLVNDSEIEQLLEIVKTAYIHGADAFILQDIFLGKILKAKFPDIVLHLSTQAGINEVGGATMAKEEGFSRVILARETPLSEIKKITKIIETEVFVHGALCSCFSGHCYMSAYVGGNSGNRGLCKQPCRKEYRLEGLSLVGEYPISLSDLCLKDEISELIDAGVSSFKIEGRMRSPEYVSSAVSLYRNILDGKEYSLSNVKRTYNRGDYTKGYLYGADENIISRKVQNHLGEKVENLLKIKGDGIITQRKNIKGDAFKILRGGIEVGNAVCLENGNLIKFKGKVKIGDELRITKDISLLSLEPKPIKKEIEVFAKVEEGQKLALSALGVTVYSDDILSTALKTPTSIEEIRDNLLKTDKYPFNINAKIEVIGKPFVPKGILNRLRSNLYERVFTLDKKPLKINDISLDFKNFYKSKYKNVILSDKFVDVSLNDAFVLAPNDYTDEKFIKTAIEKVKSDKYLFVPSFLPQKDRENIKKLLDLFDGIYADGLSGIVLSKEFSKKLIIGVGLNVFNSIDVDSLSQNSQGVVLSQELSLSQIEKFTGCNVFSFGSIRLMELLYCPFGGNCKDCKRNKDFYLLTDKLGYKFKVRRYKIGGKCRFEIYNEQLLFSNFRGNRFINLIGVEESAYADYLNGNTESLKMTRKTTNGNLKRGVI